MDKIKNYNEFITEIFGFGKREEKITDWKSQLEWIFDNYTSNKVKYLNAEVRPKRLNISWDAKRTGGHTQYMIFPSKGTKDNKGRVAMGMHEYDEWPVVSDEEYEKYKQKIQEISDYLDQKERDDSVNVGTGITNLNFDKDEMDMLHAQDQLKSLFKPHLNKELQFEAEYYRWTSESKNTKQISDIKIKVYDITGRMRGKKDFYIMVKCLMGDNERKMAFMIDKNSPTDYTEIDKIEKFSGTLNLSDDEDNLSRVELREKNKMTYPTVLFFDMVPSDWAAIEFMKEALHIIEEFNNHLIQ